MRKVTQAEAEQWIELAHEHGHTDEEGNVALGRFVVEKNAPAGQMRLRFVTPLVIAGPESADAATKTRRPAERRAFVDSRRTSSSVPPQRGPRPFTVSPVTTFAPFSSL
jgi:hypothetical protein